MAQNPANVALTGWVVDRAEEGDGLERIRFCYLDGEARELLIPVKIRTRVELAELGRLAYLGALHPPGGKIV